MVIIDNRSQRDFRNDLKRVKKLRIKSWLEYYRMYAGSETAMCSMLSVLFILLYAFTKPLAVIGGTTLQCLCLAFYCMAILSPALMLASVFSSGFRPYLYRRLQFERMILSLVKCKNYHDMDYIFDVYGEDVLASASPFSRRFLMNLQAYCAEEMFVTRFGDTEISHAKFVKGTVHVEVANRMHSRVKLRAVGITKGKERALILTDAGVILQRAA